MHVLQEIQTADSDGDLVIEIESQDPLSNQSINDPDD